MARVVRDFVLSPFQKRSVSGLNAELGPLGARHAQLEGERRKVEAALEKISGDMAAIKAEEKRLHQEWVRLVLEEHGVALPEQLPDDLRVSIDAERKHLTITAPEELRDVIYPSVAPAQPESASRGTGEAPPAPMGPSS